MKEPRDFAPTADIRQQLSFLGDRVAKQANGAVALSWFRGEQEGQEGCIKWLSRHGHRRAADALKRHLFPKDGMRKMT